MIKDYGFKKGDFEILDYQSLKASNRGAEDIWYNFHRLKNAANGINVKLIDGTIDNMYNTDQPIGPRNDNGRGYIDANVKDSTSNFPK